MKTKHTAYLRRKLSLLFALTSLVLLLMAVSVQAQEEIQEVLPEALPAPTVAPVCERTIKASVVALDQAIIYNRLGTLNPNGMIYALKQDVVATDSLKGIAAGNVRLRSNKRPRPIVLRMNNGYCLRISFTNLLSPSPLSNQPATRSAGVHVVGMELAGGIGSDGSNVTAKQPSVVGPGRSGICQLAAPREGYNCMYGTAATTSGEADGGNHGEGLFGSVDVQVRGAEWYRSRVTAGEMMAAKVATTP